jgi:hypothetical protein
VIDPVRDHSMTSHVASFNGPAPSDAPRQVVSLVQSPRAGSQALVDDQAAPVVG